MPLNDPTGNTRFVVIPVESELPWRDVGIAREPLMARAIQEYLNGAPSFSTNDEMDAIRERNSDFHTVEPWFDAIRCKAEQIVREDRLPVTIDAIYTALDITEVKHQDNINAARITNVLTSLGFYYRQSRQGKDEDGKDKRPRGWWPSQAAQQKLRF